MMTERAGEALKVGDEKLGGVLGTTGPETCRLKNPQNMQYDVVFCSIEWTRIVLFYVFSGLGQFLSWIRRSWAPTKWGPTK